MRTISNSYLTVLLPLLFHSASLRSNADLVILKDGQVVNGTVLQKDNSSVLLKFDYGTFTFPTERIKEIKQDTETPQLESPEVNKRIPNWGKLISLLAKQKWVRDIRQIPATVIDVGILKNVPYLSFSANHGLYEANIYGDADQPAGFEIGVKSYLVNNDTARSNCVEFMCTVLAQDDERQAIRRLNWHKDSVNKDSLTLEVTPPSDPDSYGGWWISAYSQDDLTKARASAKELIAITEPMTSAPEGTTASIITPTAGQTGLIPWTREDLSYARPYRTGIGYSGGGTVFVRGYYRNNGIYVQSYTRHASRR